MSRKIKFGPIEYYRVGIVSVLSIFGREIYCRVDNARSIFGIEL